MKGCPHSGCNYYFRIVKGIENRKKHITEDHKHEKLKRVEVAWILGIDYRRLRRRDFIKPTENYWPIEEINNLISTSSWVEELREEEEKRWQDMKKESAKRVEAWNKEKGEIGIPNIEELDPSNFEELEEKFKVLCKSELSKIIDPEINLVDEPVDKIVKSLSDEQIHILELLELSPCELYNIEEEELAKIEGRKRAWYRYDDPYNNWRDLREYLKLEESGLLNNGTNYWDERQQRDNDEEDDEDDDTEKTTIEKRICSAYRSNEMVCLTGEPASGKTSFVKSHFQDIYTRPVKAIWIIADPECSNGNLLRLILEVINTPRRDSYPYNKQPIGNSTEERRRQVLHRLKEIITKTNYLADFDEVICIDNAEYLKINALQELRNLNCKTEVAVVLIGTKEVLETIKQAKMEKYFHQVDL